MHYQTRAAVEDGIVAGGGTTFINLIPTLKQRLIKKSLHKKGMEIVLRSLEAPTRQIANNSGLEGSVIVEQVKNQTENGVGFNARDEKFENMVEAGIVDPAKVVVSAILNGASIAGTALTTEALIADEPDDGADAAAAAAAAGMGGMGGGMPRGCRIWALSDLLTLVAPSVPFGGPHKITPSVNRPKSSQILGNCPKYKKAIQLGRFFMCKQ